MSQRNSRRTFWPERKGGNTVGDRPVASRTHIALVSPVLPCALLAVTYRIASLQHQSDLTVHRDRVSSELDKIRGSPRRAPCRTHTQPGSREDSDDHSPGG